jgi:hypothetical protein
VIFTEAPDTVFSRLAALFDGIFNEAHSPEFTGDKNSGDVGFKILVYMRKINTPFFGAYPQTNGLGGTGEEAGPVAYALGRIDNCSLSVSNAYYILFRTGGDTGSGLDAAVQINKGMKRNGLVKAGFLCKPDFFIDDP